MYTYRYMIKSTTCKVWGRPKTLVGKASLGRLELMVARTGYPRRVVEFSLERCLQLPVKAFP